MAGYILWQQTHWFFFKFILHMYNAVSRRSSENQRLLYLHNNCSLSDITVQQRTAVIITYVAA